MSDSFEDNEATLVTQLAAIIFQNDPDCLSSLRQALGDESKEYDREMYLESISCKLHFAGHGIVLLYKYSETLPIVILRLADIERLLEAAAELTQGEVVSLGD